MVVIIQVVVNTTGASSRRFAKLYSSKSGSALRVLLIFSVLNPGVPRCPELPTAHLRKTFVVSPVPPRCRRLLLEFVMQAGNKKNVPNRDAANSLLQVEKLAKCML